MNQPAARSIEPPLRDDEVERIGTAVAGLTPAQLQWASGYIAGLAAANSPAPAAEAEAASVFSILYASQTGNGAGIARALADQATKAGFAVGLHDLADYRPANLKRESLAVFVISTHGDGEPPDDAELFHEFLLSSRAPRLPNLRYAVLALGDRAYVNFCQTGRELDSRLDELGGKRLLPVVECDVDFEAAAASWQGDILTGLAEWLDVAPAAPRLHAVETTRPCGRDNPFAAVVLTNQKITGRASTKDVRHIELSIEGSGLRYEPGDSLAVVASNPPRLVAEILECLGADDNTQVLVDEEPVELAEVLTHRFEITATTPVFLRDWADLSGARDLAAILEPGRQAALGDFLRSHQLIDVIRRFPADIDPDRFVGLLRKLGPRSYSIASSPLANPDEVHLTVAAVRYRAFDRQHWGAASTHIADRVAEGDTLSVFVEQNRRFRLPADDSVDIIMIGPGTGVAPFRAFVEERAERGANGRNWLFFGDRNFGSDFLYQLEWHRHLKQGSLTRLDVAFSRDQEEKVYVQHRIRERGAELYDWIESGAVVYVCGDASRMAPDVNEALVDVIARESGASPEAAGARLAGLRRDGRYLRDVY